MRFIYLFLSMQNYKEYAEKQKVRFVVQQWNAWEKNSGVEEVSE